VLGAEAVVHHTASTPLRTKFAAMVVKSILVRFREALSCMDACCIADGRLEPLPAPAQAGETKVGGIDLNQRRMR
jgi:hypothetical protein